MIHPTAIIHKDSVLGFDVEIGAFSIIGPNVKIGDGTIVEERCSIGANSGTALAVSTSIGSQSVIRSGTVIYGGVVSGPLLQTGHNAIIREGSRLGEQCSVGSGSQLQGGSLLGDRVRLHSNVHIGAGVRLEEDVWLFSNVLLTNDPNPPSETILEVVVHRESVILAGSILMPGVTIGPRSVVLPQTKVTRSFETEGELLGGVPARSLGRAEDIKLYDNRSKPAYPWADRFPSEGT